MEGKGNRDGKGEEKKKGTWIGENEIPHGIKRAPSRPSLLLNRLSFRRLQHHPRPKAFYPAVCRNTYRLSLSSLSLYSFYTVYIDIVAERRPDAFR